MRALICHCINIKLLQVFSDASLAVKMLYFRCIGSYGKSYITRQSFLLISVCKRCPNNVLSHYFTGHWISGTAMHPKLCRNEILCFSIRCILDIHNSFNGHIHRQIRLKVIASALYIILNHYFVSIKNLSSFISECHNMAWWVFIKIESGTALSLIRNRC